MSVIVYKDGILAADSRAYGGAYQSSPGQKAKIHHLEDGTRVGVASAVLGMPERFVEWLRSGADPEKWGSGEPDCCVMMVKPSGGLFLADGGLYFSGPIECEYHAIGSGAKYALGAMAMGAGAIEAVEVAMKFDPHCGGVVLAMAAELVA